MSFLRKNLKEGDTMPDASVDRLTIELEATVGKASSEIDKLTKKLDKLTVSLTKIDFSKLNGFSNSISQLGTAMQSMNSVNSDNFKNISNNLSKLNKIDETKLESISEKINNIRFSVSSLTGATQGISQISELANGIKQLGYKSADKAIDNIPKLSSSMSKLMKELSKAPKVSQNLIDMTNALAKLARTGSSSGKAAQSLSTAFNGISKSSVSAIGGIKKIQIGLGGILKKITPILGAFQLFSLGKQSIEIASSLTEVQNVVNTTFGDYKQKIEDLANTSISKLGMSEVTAKKIGSTFQAMGGAMGFAQEEMTNMSVELVKLTGDMASFYDVAQEDVGKALQSIFTGETEPLRKYGLDLTQATLQQWALNNGIDVTVSKMSQLEKAQLRYQYVMENTGAAQGDFSKTMNSWSNQVSILKQQLQQLASVIGGTLINALKPLVNALNSAMSYIIAFAKTISNALGKIFGWQFEEGVAGGVASDFENAESSAGGIADATGQAAKNIDKMKKGVREFDELKTIESNSDNSSSGGTSGGGTSGGGATAAGGQWTQAESIFKNFESEIDSLYELGACIGKKLTDAMNSIEWDSIFEKARKFGTGLAEFLNGLISPELFGALGRTIANALNTVVDSALSFGITFDWENLGLSIASGINEFFATFDFKDLANTIDAWVQGLWTTLKTTIENIKWEDVWSGIKDFFKELDIETVGIVIGAVTVKKILKMILSNGITSWIGTALSSLIKEVPIVLSNIKVLAGGGLIAETGFISKLANALALAAGGAATLHEALTLAFGAVATTIAGIVAVIGEIALAVTNFFAMWKDGFSWVNEALMVVGVALAAVGAVILGAPALVAGVVAAIVAVVATIAVIVHDNWESIVSTFKNLKDKAKEAVDSVVSKFKELVTSVKNKLTELKNNISNKFEEIKRKIKEKVESIKKTVSEKFTEAKDKVAEIVLELKDKIVEKFTAIKDTISEKVELAKTTTKEKFESIKNTVKEKVSDAYNKVKNNFSNIYTTIKEKSSSSFSIAKTKFGEIYEKIKEKVSAVYEKVKHYFDLVKTKIETVMEKVSGVITNFKNAIDDTISSIKDFFSNSNRSFSINLPTDIFKRFYDSLSGVVDKIKELFGYNGKTVSVNTEASGSSIPGKKDGGVFSGGVWKSIKGYAVGGYPSYGQLFYARENGPELVGTIGSHTAVMNNNQIVDSVAAGVYSAVVAAMAQSSGNTNITFQVEGDPNGLFKVVQKKADEYSKRTGNPAFI